MVADIGPFLISALHPIRSTLPDSATVERNKNTCALLWEASRKAMVCGFQMVSERSPKGPKLLEEASKWPASPRARKGFRGFQAIGWSWLSSMVILIDAIGNQVHPS